jgi:RecB family exonuclease
MHQVLRTFYDAQRMNRKISESELLEQLRQGLADAGIPDRYQYELYLRQGREQLQQFFEVARTTQPDVLQTEHMFELQVGGAKLRGRIDRVDRIGSGSIAIVDYKTGKPKSQEEADKSLQLSLYALAAQEIWKEKAAQLIFYNLENNTPIVTTRSESELEAAREKVGEVAENISAGRFPAKPGYQCTFCPYHNLCPATEKVVSLPQKKSATRAN